VQDAGLKITEQIIAADGGDLLIADIDRCQRRNQDLLVDRFVIRPSPYGLPRGILGGASGA
jgi:hypothetical protein